MMTFIIIAFTIFFIIILALLSNVYIYIKFDQIKKGANVTIRALFFIKIKLIIKLEREDKTLKLNLYTNKEKRTLLSIPKIIEIFKNAKNEKISKRKARNQMIKDLFAQAHFYVKKLKFSYGNEDASKTVNVVSFVRILINVLLGVFSTYTSIEIHDCAFLPQFQKKYFEIDFDCIIKLKAAHITIAYIKYLIKRR